MDIDDKLCHIKRMKRSALLGRMERLDLLSARLKSDEPLTIGAIAAEFGVSVRTLHRDIQILRDRGQPIEADRGRGGGVRLHWTWGLGRLNLDYKEAVDLLVSLAIAEQIGSPILMANLSPIRRKLMASFSNSLKEKINKLKSRILVGQTASPFVLSTHLRAPEGVIERMHESFLLTRELEIVYCDEAGNKTSRTIEPHFLLLNYPVWYILAWDHLRRDVRLFRCDRVQSAMVKPDTFNLMSLSRFEATLEGVELISS